jgi:hypothetical protein
MTRRSRCKVRQWLTAGVIGLFAVAFLIAAMVPAVSLIVTASTVIWRRHHDAPPKITP